MAPHHPLTPPPPPQLWYMWSVTTIYVAYHSRGSTMWGNMCTLYKDIVKTFKMYIFIYVMSTHVYILPCPFHMLVNVLCALSHNSCLAVNHYCCTHVRHEMAKK